MNFSIRKAAINDAPAIQTILPRLADFDIPPGRNPKHLWEGDEQILLDWAAGKNSECFVFVAVDQQDEVVGVSITTLREELLSHEPSAHLEVLVLAKVAEGYGLGTQLVEAAEQAAKENGAQSITLHVFARNTRARKTYERLGYDGELMRYTKPLT